MGELRLHLSRDLAAPGRADAQANAAIFQRAQVVLALEGAIQSLLDRVNHKDVHVLQDAGQDEVGRIGVLYSPVGVNTDQQTSAAFLQDRQGALANRASHRHDDVGAFVQQALAQPAAIVGAVKVAREQAGLRGRIPAQNLDRGAFDLVVMLHTSVEAIHEGSHCRELDAAVGGNDTSRGCRSRQVAIQEARLVHRVGAAAHVGDNRVIGLVDDGELLVRVSFSRRLGGVSQQETDRNDQVAAFLNEGVDVLFVIGLGLGLEVLAFDTQLSNSILNALPSRSIEGAIIDTAGVRHLADLEGLGLWRGFGRCLGSNFFRRNRFSGLLFNWSSGGGSLSTAGGQNHGRDQQKGKQRIQFFRHFGVLLLRD